MSNSNDLKILVDKMKNAGIRILVDKTELEIDEAYAVLGGKSSVRYLQNEPDGINGFVILCAEDEVDMNRLCNTLNRAYYDTEDEKRPCEILF